MKRSIKPVINCLIALVSCFSVKVEAIELPAVPLSRLGSDQFSARELAQEELLEWCRKRPGPSMDELFRQTRVSKDPEVRERCRSILKELVTDEYLKDGEGYIGIALMDDLANIPGEPNPRNAIRISLVEAGSPGEKAGLKANDLIVALNGKTGPEVQGFLKFQEEIRKRKPQTKVRLKVLRGVETVEVEIRLGRRLPLPNDLFFDGGKIDPEAIERASKDAYFRRWYDQKKLAE